MIPHKEQMLMIIYFRSIKKYEEVEAPKKETKKKPIKKKLGRGRKKVWQKISKEDKAIIEDNYLEHPQWTP